VRVIVADDNLLMRSGVVRVLEACGFQVVAEVDSVDALRDAVRREQPDVAVVDIRMPPTQTDEGARAAVELREQHPDMGVLLLSQFVEARHALRLLRENAAGFGYLLKDRVVELEDFGESVRRVGNAGTAIDPKVVEQLLGRRRPHDPLEDLTPREREVLTLMAEGRSNHGIAGQLFLSPKTVEAHIRQIFAKLGLGEAPEDHRRVLAVVKYLAATEQ
jgi:DNA-binding NarL/FixJ family response regulator